YACAGHPAPLIMGAAEHDPVSTCSSPALGWGLPTGRRQTTVVLGDGDIATFFTDGLIEARTEDGFLGREGLEELIRELGAAGSASRKAIALGTLKGARRSAACARSSSAVTDASARSTTVATTASPHSSSGRAWTAASATAGCSTSTASTSAGATFSPPLMIVSLLRPVTTSEPSPSNTPRSPVCSSPPPEATVGPDTMISASSAMRTRVQNSGAPPVVTCEHASVSP